VRDLALIVSGLGVGMCLSLSACGPGDSGGHGGSGGTVNPPNGTGGKTGTGAAGSTQAGATGGAGTTSAGAGAGVGGGASGAGGSGGSTGGTSGATGGTGGAAAFDAGVDVTPMPGNICTRLAQIQCAAEAFCCANPGRDQTTCEQDMLSGYCTSKGMADVIAAQPPAAFDAAQATVVFTHIKELAAACDPAVTAYGESPQGLRSMFKGTKAPSTSCAPQNLNDMAMAGGALASCTMGDTYACLPATTGLIWTCNKKAGARSRCFSDLNCTAGLFCNNPDLKPAGSTCMQRKAVGSPCTALNECESLLCAGGQCIAADKQGAYCLKQLQQ
jgi:hypothetical protein